MSINFLVRNASLSSRQDELAEDKVQHLPSFLEALSCIVEEMEEVCRAKYIVLFFSWILLFGFSKFHFHCM